MVVFKKVGGHMHVVPTKNDIPKSISDPGYFNIELFDEKWYMTQKFMNNWKRPISSNMFFAEEQMEWNRKNNIVHSGVITLSQMYCNMIPDKSAAIDIISFQNDYNVKLAETYGNELSCGWVVNPLYIDEAILECEKRLKEGKLKFICICTHYRLANGKFVTATDLNCHWLFTWANANNVPIQIHPYDYEFICTNQEDIDVAWIGHTVKMLALTAEFFAHFAAKNIYGKYPNLRFYFAHGNYFGFSSLKRQQKGFAARPDLYKDMRAPIDILTAKNVWVDTIMHDEDNIWTVKRKIGILRIMLGFDNPYPLGCGVDYLGDGDYPGRILDLAEEAGFITAEEKRIMMQDVFFDWIYGEGDQRATDLKKIIFAQ